MNKIEKGSIVRYKNGFYRVSCTNKSAAGVISSVNLKNVNGRTVQWFSVPFSEITEAYAEWEKAWHQSETYQSQ